MCRRGMKELDILLEGFLDRHEPELRQGAWPDLEHLLGCEDDVLWDYLRGQGAAPARDFGGLLSAIRDGHGTGA